MVQAVISWGAIALGALIVFGLLVAGVGILVRAYDRWTRPLPPTQVPQAETIPTEIIPDESFPEVTGDDPTQNYKRGRRRNRRRKAQKLRKARQYGRLKTRFERL